MNEKTLDCRAMTASVLSRRRGKTLYLKLIMLKIDIQERTRRLGAVSSR